MPESILGLEQRTRPDPGRRRPRFSTDRMYLGDSWIRIHGHCQHPGKLTQFRASTSDDVSNAVTFLRDPGG